MKVLILLCAIAAAYAEHVYEKTCIGKPEPGVCDGQIPRWYYDVNEGECGRFLYSGCGGNGNRYNSRDECMKNCKVCPENQHYEECETTCLVTCDNFKNPPKKCPLWCEDACYCDKGYVKASDGRCIKPENCPSQSKSFEKTCLAKPEPGVCYAYFRRWYYDVSVGSCRKFVYGGCGGNGNRYNSEEECMKNCEGIKLRESSSEVCDLPADVGNCLAIIPRYYFDKDSGKCKRFVYGGCGGNGNNFKTLEECEGTCG